MGYDFSQILPAAAKASPTQPAITLLPAAPTQAVRNRLYFESSRAGGTFATQNHTNWDAARNARFKAWKDVPDVQREETAAMAGEIVSALRSVFGGTLPTALRFTSPPRGKTPVDQPHPAQVLSRCIAASLCRPYEVCVERATADQEVRRNRYENLRDDSQFERVVGINAELLTVVIDDVSTTGNTLNRMRAALSGIPTLCFVYVIWH